MLKTCKGQRSIYSDRNLPINTRTAIMQPKFSNKAFLGTYVNDISKEYAQFKTQQTQDIDEEYSDRFIKSLDTEVQSIENKSNKNELKIIKNQRPNSKIEKGETKKEVKKIYCDENKVIFAF